MKKNKNCIHIIGGGLYGCLLAHQLLKKKYKIVMFEKSNELISSFNSIELGNLKLNNGFHGLDLPRAKDLFLFFKKNLKIKFNIFEIKRKILFERSLIDYKAKRKEWPKKIQSYLKNGIKYYKSQKLNFFFKASAINLFKKNSLRYFNSFEKAKSFFLPWFLPADVKHISEDEGDNFRSLVRQNKIKGYVALPRKHLFSIAKKKFYNYLVSKGVTINFNTEIKIINNKVRYYKKNKEIFFDKSNIKKIFYCLSPAFLLKDISFSHFKKLNNYKKFTINCIMKIRDENFKNDFNEILSLNNKIPFVNRIYSLNYYKYVKDKKTSYLVLEMLSSKNFLNLQNKKNLINEIKVIFNLKKKPSLVDYKVTRQIYSLEEKWIVKSKKILKAKITKKLNLKYINNFYPLNMSKAWMNALTNSKHVL